MAECDLVHFEVVVESCNKPINVRVTRRHEMEPSGNRMRSCGWLEQDARFRAAARKGIAQADREEFIEEEEMEARIERMLNS